MKHCHAWETKKTKWVAKRVPESVINSTDNAEILLNDGCTPHDQICTRPKQYSRNKDLILKEGQAPRPPIWCTTTNFRPHPTPQPHSNRFETASPCPTTASPSIRRHVPSRSRLRSIGLLQARPPHPFCKARLVQRRGAGHLSIRDTKPPACCHIVASQCFGRVPVCPPNNRGVKQSATAQYSKQWHGSSFMDGRQTECCGKRTAVGNLMQHVLVLLGAPSAIPPQAAPSPPPAPGRASYFRLLIDSEGPEQPSVTFVGFM